MRPTTPSRLAAAAVAALALAAPPAAFAFGSTTQTRAGDVLRFAIPAATLGTEWWRGEHEGAWQYAQALGVSLVATEALKHATHERRPDGTDTLSFPSGHAVMAYSAASYVQFRYGTQPALPLYLLGTYVGYTRVQAHRHRWSDVAGSLAVTTAASAWRVSPKGGSQVAVMPRFGRHGVGVEVVAGF